MIDIDDGEGLASAPDVSISTCKHENIDNANETISASSKLKAFCVDNKPEC